MVMTPCQRRPGSEFLPLQPVFTIILISTEIHIRRSQDLAQLLNDLGHGLLYPELQRLPS
eukprot:5625364-Karenia_brevis.AAC.1